MINLATQLEKNTVLSKETRSHALLQNSSETLRVQDRSSFLVLLSDLFQLTKPRLSSLVLFTMSAGIILAPETMPFAHAFWAVIATFGIIGASNSFNMYFDRHIDGLMDRTKMRPIPTGRLQPKVAIWFGTALLLVSLPVLYFTSNLLTLLLGAIACVLYSCVYTPLKTKTHFAVYIGAVPGGIPMLMGYTAATNTLDGMGLALFAILLVWQLPHFLSIALNLEEDYRKANVQVYSVALGEKKTRTHLVWFSLFFWATTLLPLAVSSAGWLYAIVANVLGLLFFWGSLLCLKSRRVERTYFFGTLFYLPILLLTLIFEINYLYRPF